MDCAGEHDERTTAGTRPRPRLADLLRYELDPYFRDRARTVFELLDPQPGERLLDCGCGKGFFVSLFGRLSDCDVVAVDSDVVALGIAARAVAFPRLVQADVARLPFADGTFDKIHCGEVLEHVADDDRALHELRRVLAPDGVVVVTVPSRTYPFAWDPVNKMLEAAGLAPVRRGAFAGAWTGHRRLYDPRRLAAQATDAGLVVVESRLLTRFCLPFTHNLLYGLGLALFESGRLPARWCRGADRRFDPDASRPAVPLRALGALTGAVGALNRRFPPRRVSVGIALRLRK